MVSLTCWPWLTGPLAGQKLCHYHQLQLWTWHGRLSGTGLRVLAPLRTYPLIGVCNLLLRFSVLWLTAWEWNSIARPHITHRLTVSVSVSIGRWRLPCGPASKTQTGSTDYLGLCLASEPHQKKTYSLHLQNWFMTNHFGFQGIFSPAPLFLGLRLFSGPHCWTINNFSHQSPPPVTVFPIPTSLLGFN